MRSPQHVVIYLLREAALNMFNGYVSFGKGGDPESIGSHAVDQFEIVLCHIDLPIKRNRFNRNRHERLETLKQTGGGNSARFLIEAVPFGVIHS